MEGSIRGFTVVQLLLASTKAVIYIISYHFVDLDNKLKLTAI